MNFKKMIVFLVSSFCFQISAQAASSKSKVIAYEECPSGVLRVTFNVDNKASKNDLVNGLKMLFDFGGGYAITPVLTNTLEVEFKVRTSFCDPSEDCGVPYGWEELQWRLKLVKASRVVCDPSAAQAPAPAAAPESQKHDGGVVVSN